MCGGRVGRERGETRGETRGDEMRGGRERVYTSLIMSCAFLKISIIALQLFLLAEIDAFSSNYFTVS